MSDLVKKLSRVIVPLASMGIIGAADLACTDTKTITRVDIIDDTVPKLIIDTLRVSSSKDTLAIGTIFANRIYVDKIQVNTIDPVYFIGNSKYATFGPSIVGGVKEEVSGNVGLEKRMYSINFDSLERGSNLWLFNQVTDFGERMGNLQVVLTPGFNGRVWYEKDFKKNKLTIYGSQSGEVSYRLTANRFDWKEVLAADPGNFGMRVKEKK